MPRLIAKAIPSFSRLFICNPRMIFHGIKAKHKSMVPEKTAEGHSVSQEWKHEGAKLHGSGAEPGGMGNGNANSPLTKMPKLALKSAGKQVPGVNGCQLLRRGRQPTH